MSLIEYHKSIGKELEVLKNRVRNLLGEEFHRYSDGKHKESILKNVLANHLPSSISAKNGFIRFDGDDVSTEIDLLLFHNSRPLLFKTEDLVITTPITVFGGIEVKTTLTSSGLQEAITKLAVNSERTRSQVKTAHWQEFDFSKIGHAQLPWFSFFAFASEVNDANFLELLNSGANKNLDRVIRCACLGPNKFVRFWDSKKDQAYANKSFTGWKIYDLPGLAFSYFISNMIWQDQVPTNETNPWFATFITV